MDIKDMQKDNNSEDKENNAKTIKTKSKKIIKWILIFIILLLICFMIKTFNLFDKKATKLPAFEGINVVPTMSDKITQDSCWCGTFQLVWNEMKHELVGQDIVFSPQIELAKNLNKEAFNKQMISDEYYYIKYGIRNFQLKAEIEKGILDKFNQTSDLLNKIDWLQDDEIDETKYLFYAMLYREFQYSKPFEILENGKFANKYKNVKYFGKSKYRRRSYQ